MKKLRLYPEVKPKGLDLSKEKIVTVPNQAMTIETIIARFTRGEHLPIQHPGQFSTRFGDLEKLKHLDFTEQEQKATDLRKFVGSEREYLAKQKAAKKARIAAKRAKLAPEPPDDKKPIT